MLVLTRKSGQTVKIDNDITIDVLSVSKNQVRLGFTAPKSVAIYREEIYPKNKHKIMDSIVLELPLVSNQD